jgi:hypothetical protein
MYIAIILTLLMSLTVAEENFTPSASIGGYGELHWNKSFDSDQNITKNTMDFHRFIIYTGYNFTPEWSFKSELEIEHNMIDGDGDYDGEVELEQAYVNYHSDLFGFQAGVILPSVGIINEYHEPPLFVSVERPLYSKYVIPTTWFGNGFAFYGMVSDFKWRVALMEDLDGSSIANGIRSARGKGYKTTGYDLVKNFSLSYTGILGLRVGVSATMNDAPVSIDEEGAVSSSIGVTLFELNTKYDANNIYAVMEYGAISYDNSNYLVTEDNPETTDIDETDEFTYGNTSGYYIDLGYNIGNLIGLNKIMPWFRISNVSRDLDNDSKITDLTRFGLTWWPTNQIAFKVDYASVKIKSDENPTSEFNLGVGYNF